MYKYCPWSCLFFVLMLFNSICGMEKQITTGPTEWNSKKYNENSSLQYAVALNLLSKVELQEKHNILDIGCGNGRVSKYIAQIVTKGKVIGVDSSLNQIEFAREHNSAPNILFKHMNILDFKTEEQFDYIFCFSSFSWIKNQPRLLEIINKLLKPVGQFVAGIAHPDSAYLCTRINMMSTDKWKEYFVDYQLPYYPCNEQNMKSLLDNVGMGALEMGKNDFSYIFKTREEFIEFMRAVPAQLDRIPKELRSEFLNNIVNEYLKVVPQKEDGSIVLFPSGLVVRAVKIYNRQ